MTLKIIGTGFGRTGTNSMRLALNELGFGPCHHMHEVIEKPLEVPYWLAAAKGQPVDWNQVFEGYNSCVDWPSAAYWRELAEFYPEAKILLTTRSEESWYKSITETIFKNMRDREGKSLEDLDPFSEMIERMVTQNTFGGDITTKSHVIDVYNANIKATQDAFSDDRLLTYSIGDGWEPLCTWLDVPVPETPFPKTNSTKQFNER